MTQSHAAPDGWGQFQEILRAGASKGNWDTWLSRIEPEFQGRTPTLVAPSEFHLRWVRDKHGDLIEDAYLEIYDSSPRYKVIEVENQDQVVPADPVTGADAEAAAGDKGKVLTPATNLITRYRFESFVVGQSNRFAWAAAMAVAEQPGAHYNPLFIYGGAGLGKTHLLNAVGHQALEMYPNLVVRYVSSENFLNDFIDSIRRKRPDDFKHRYRGVDILLLDDVQFFEGKEQILEEFFHTFNSLYESGQANGHQLRSASHGTSRHWRTGCAADSNGGFSPTSSPRTWRPGSPSSSGTPSSPRDRSRSTCWSTSPAWYRTTSVSWKAR